jgi:hypothetical protein
MNASGDDTDTILASRLTAERRRRIYEDEKRLIEQSAPVFSKRTKIVAGVYLLGCVLIYFGIGRSAMDFYLTRQWTYQPEPEFADAFIEAVMVLIRPFAAVVVCGWAVAIPPLLVWGLWSYGEDIVRFCRLPIPPRRISSPMAGLKQETSPVGRCPATPATARCKALGTASHRIRAIFRRS